MSSLRKTTVLVWLMMCVEFVEEMEQPVQDVQTQQLVITTLSQRKMMDLVSSVVQE
jgi:hypothetical protein